MLGGEGISSRWPGSSGVQIGAPSRQVLIDRELEVDGCKRTEQRNSEPERNGTDYGSVPSFIHRITTRSALPLGR
jgi:hypothetical protein